MFLTDSKYSSQVKDIGVPSIMTVACAFELNSSVDELSFVAESLQGIPLKGV